MEQLIGAHIAAEMAGDPAGAVAVYTHDVEHDAVGSPLGPLSGRDAAQDFYGQLITDLHVERMDLNRSYYGADFAVTEHQCTGTVTGQMLGIPGAGRRVSFRLLHVWEFRNDLISRENVWLDSAAIAAQLT